jgi:hypothetical protein
MSKNKSKEKEVVKKWIKWSDDFYQTEATMLGMPEHRIKKTDKGWRIEIKNQVEQEKSDDCYETLEEAMKACYPSVTSISVISILDEIIGTRISSSVQRVDWEYWWNKLSDDLYETESGGITIPQPPGDIRRSSNKVIPRHRVQRTDKGWQIVIKEWKECDDRETFYETYEEAMKVCQPEVDPRVGWIGGVSCIDQREPYSWTKYSDDRYVTCPPDETGLHYFAPRRGPKYEVCRTSKGWKIAKRWSDKEAKDDIFSAGVFYETCEEAMIACQPGSTPKVSREMVNGEIVRLKQTGRNRPPNGVNLWTRIILKILKRRY